MIRCPWWKPTRKRHAWTTWRRLGNAEAILRRCSICGVIVVLGPLVARVIAAREVVAT